MIFPRLRLPVGLCYGREVKPLRIVAICALVFGAYFLANIPELYSRVRLDRQFVALSRYQFERTPAVAIVGSSMSFRLREGYFGVPVRNLSIGGGSPITGLAIIASYQALPKLILVETNIMSRPLDAALVEQFGKNSREPYQWFKLARAAISALYFWSKFQSETENVARLPRLKPTDYDIKQSVADAYRENHRPDWEKLMRPNVDQLKRLADILTARGCKVLLFEMPSPVQDTPYAKIARTLAHEAFSNPAQWITIQDSTHQLRWLDASHMDERSAIITASQIEAAIKERE